MSDVIRFPQFLKSCSRPASGLDEAELAADDVKMSDLYGGPGKNAAHEGPRSDSDNNISFLQQSGETAIPTVPGWSNQELADLYRTQRILALAGVTTEVDRGITDEGDPWFVFMDSQGEVLVHFSRFDGTYLVSSHLQDAPIKGESLQDLVTQFSRRVQPVESPGQTAQNVVSMARRSRDVVFIHPAAALAALVWSVYLMSDELIAATPMIAAGEAEGSGSTPTEQAASGDLQAQGQAAEPLTSASKAQPISSDPALAKQAMVASSNRDGFALGFSGQSASAVGVSLSLIALASGLPLPTSNAAEIVSHNGSAQKLSVESLSAALAQVKAKEKALLVASEAMHLEQREIDAVALSNENEMAAALNIDLDMEAAAVVQLIEPTQTAETSSFPAHIPVQEPNAAPRSEAPVQTEEAAQAAKEETPTASASAAPVSTKEVSFLQSFDAAFETFEVSRLGKIAQDDLAQLLSTELGQLFSTETAAAPEPLSPLTAPVPLAPIVPAHHFEAFDQEARVYLDFLLRTYDNVKVLNLPTEIIFIHMDVFEKSGAAPEIYAKSWSFDDGGTVSTIGLKSDMIQFDLIA
ncbi:MAG: hypothetical protein ABJN39_10565 [Sulfitobacter sp.]